MRKFKVLLLLIVFLPACSSIGKDKQEIKALINANRNAAENEDLRAYMATIHPGSPIYEATETGMKSMFDMYDFKYEIRDIRFIEMAKTGARVEWVQKTVKVSGPEFKNQQATVVHIFSKHNGKWKMFSGEITDIVYD